MGTPAFVNSEPNDYLLTIMKLLYYSMKNLRDKYSIELLNIQLSETIQNIQNLIYTMYTSVSVYLDRSLQHAILY